MVEAAVDRSVQRDPQVLVKALFPLMGPAIRRSIASMFESMIRSLNETLERSLSLEGLRWRLQALQTGKPFAEIVLLQTLEYRVEQVLLIDEKSGLLMQHVVDSAVPSQDVELVSGMLSAIKSFVEDSFRTNVHPHWKQ
jgi:OOP family OmpA-OmpF porin